MTDEAIWYVVQVVIFLVGLCVVWFVYEKAVARRRWSRPTVLGVWPVHGENPLDYLGEMEGIRNSAFELIPLTGTVTTADFVRFFYNNDFDILHFGTHGTSGKLLLSDGINVGGGWMSGLLKSSSVSLLVLTACNSEEVGRNVFENTPVGHVIVTLRDITDEDAKRFSVELYRVLSLGGSIKRAFEVARLAVGNDAWRSFVLFSR